MEFGKGQPRTILADKRVETFFGDVMNAALKQKLSDAELCAILSSIVGRMIGFSQPGIDRQTLIDTAAYNLAGGHELAPELQAKLAEMIRKPN